MLVPTGTQLNPILRFSPRIDVWKPLAPTPDELQGENFNQGLLVRLKSGESVDSGRQQLQAILNRMYRELAPDLKTELLIELTPIREIYSGKVRQRMLLVLGASALLLLIACVNIANLFLARVTNRAGEFAIRMALGAGRARVLGQILSESMIIAILGGAIGAIIASFGADLLAVYGPDEVRILAGSQLGAIVLLFSTAISLGTGVICGIFPAWQAYRHGAATGLQEGARMAIGAGRSRHFQRVLVGLEMALGTSLLASSGLLLHSFIKVMGADRGYAVERVLAADLTPPGQRYSTGQQKADYYRELTTNIRSLPGVLAAGAISDLPATSGTSGSSQTIFYDTDTNFMSVVMQRPIALIRSVTPGYFAASGSALRAGRFVTEQDQLPAAVISESLATRLWPGDALTNVIGRTFRQGDVKGPLISVLGIVADVRPGAVDQELFPQIYRPHHQIPRGSMTVVVMTSQEPGELAAGIRAEIRKLDANVPITGLRTMREIVSASVAERRFQLVLTSLFALVALLLGAVGIYGVVSYSVTCRTREIGLRIALGAERSDVMRWVFSDGMRPVLIGFVIGLGGAVIFAQTLRSILFGITPTDPLSLGSVALVLLITSALACYFPAHRAARVDPMIALRHE
ncbi:MAG: FtsX-like permease family protein [Acidobacteria bacterium]|nr:FtsX-like permease family protein [Acidobacteriota bacterium]